MAAVAGLEPDVIGALIELLARRGYGEEALLRTMLRFPDPGASLAETILAAGIEPLPLQGFRMSAPVQRHLGNLIGLRRPLPKSTARAIGPWTFQWVFQRFPLMRGRAHRIEYILWRESRTPERWLTLARLALEHGSPDAATAWAERALAGIEAAAPMSFEARRLLGLARAELGRINLRAGAGSQARAGDYPFRVGSPIPPKEMLALADAELARGAARWNQTDYQTLGWIVGLAESLGRTGRARDAEVLLRKMLDLPIETDTTTFALGLQSRDMLLSFLGSPFDPAFLEPRRRRELWDDLVQVLRAQGRHLEADAMERRRDEDVPPGGDPPA